MIDDAFLNLLKTEFPFGMTAGQEEAAQRLVTFLFGGGEKDIFILRGYAGTGKTTLVAALVRALHKIERDAVLLAPTGRAAKVFALNAGFPAYTVHKQIYRQRSMTSEISHFDLDLNKHLNTVFIVDESSMISDVADTYPVFGSGSLLHDLLKYVYSSPGCRIVFVGDNAQLPPVGDGDSPALSASFLKGLGFRPNGCQLTEVMRQEHESGILANATELRDRLGKGLSGELPKVRFRSFNDVGKLSGDDIVETLQKSYEADGTDQTIVLTRSNKQTNVYNAGIRSTFFDREDVLTRGDLVMIVRNNYYWTEQLSLKYKNDKTGETVPMDFIANGDIAEVTTVKSYPEFYGLHFADVTLRFPDYEDFEMDVRVLLDALHADGPALPAEEGKKLFDGVNEDYADERDKRKRMQKVRLDPNYNALQLKYAYAVTCHKAQGGQWRNVFVDQGWLPPDGVDESYYRWLYTAFTRATKNLFLVNWPRQQDADES